MEKIDWLSLLGWQEDQLEELRFLGYTYIKQGKYTTALTFFKALIVLSPDSIYDLQTLGALYLQIGENLEALHFLEQALQKDPTHLPSQLNKTKALLLLGYKRQGIRMASELSKAEDRYIANQAEALVLSYQ